MSRPPRAWQRLFPAELAGDGGWVALAPPAAPDAGELWAQLARTTDARYEQPRARPDVAVEQLPGDQGAIISDHERGVYVHLPPENLFLWQRMDGARTQVDLVVEYCLRYKALAPARIAGLVESLREQELLAEPADELYPKLRDAMLKTTPLGWVNRITQTFLQREFAISGIDGAVGRVYRAGGWLLYTRPAQALLWLLGGAGLVAFLLLLRGGQFSVLGDGTLLEGALLLFAFQIIALFLHELAHALTVKAFKRRVRRAGLLLLYGMPGAFVDTTDIWPAGKRAQLAVTWAGPFCNLVLGGIAALLISANPGAALAPLVFQFAVSQYVLVAFNLTPFIRLDGYYLLADWLQIANLRPRALGFLRNGLPHRVRQSWAEGRLLPSLNREELILVVFGVISLLWVVNLFGLAVITAPIRLARVADRLISSGPAGRSPLAIFFMLTGALLTTLLLIRSAVALRGWLRSLGQRLGRAPAWRVALVFAGLALLVAAIPDLLASQQAVAAAAVYAYAIALAAAGLAWLCARRLFAELRGARLRVAMGGLLVSATALAGVDVLASASALLPAGMLWLLAWLPLLWLVALLPGLAGAALAATALARLARAALGWAALLVLMAASAFGMAAVAPAAPITSMLPLAGHTLLAAALLLHWQLVRRPLGAPRVALRLQSGDPAALLATTMAMVVAELVAAVGEVAGRSAQLELVARFNRHAADADWPLWLTMKGHLGDRASAAIEQSAPIYRAALADLHNQITAVLGPAFAGDAQLQALAELPSPMRALFQRWVEADLPAGQVLEGDDDRTRLRLAGRRLAETLVLGCARVYGWPLTDEALGGFNRAAGASGWSLYIRGNGRIADNLQGTLLVVAQVYRDALQDLLGRVAGIAGVAFVERGVVQVYDGLPWEAREVADTLLFSRISWARRLARAPRDDRRDAQQLERLAFLRTIPLLGWLAPDDLAGLAAQITVRRVRAGRPIAAPGSYLEHALIVRYGRVHAVAARGPVRQVVEQIGVGGLIGIRSIVEGQPAPYEYLAQSDAELWLVPQSIVAGQLGPLLNLQDSLEEAGARSALLARIPLFAGLDAARRATVASALETVQLAAGDAVLTEGAASSGFYVVRAGELDVTVRGADNADRHLSSLSQGEFFGEIALLRRCPVTATVCARTNAELLRLAPADFYALLADSLAGSLEQVQSRRDKARAQLIQTVS